MLCRLCEAAFQDDFERAVWVHRYRYPGATEKQAIAHVTRTEHRQRASKNRAFRKVRAASTETDAIVDSASAHLLCMDVLRQLKRLERSAVVLRHYLEVSESETATRLNVQRRRVQALVEAAMKKSCALFQISAQSEPQPASQSERVQNLWRRVPTSDDHPYIVYASP